MKTNKRMITKSMTWAVLLLLVMSFAGCKSITVKDSTEVPGNPGEPGNPGNGEIKILLVGSSYLGYNNFTDMLKNFAEKIGKKVIIEEEIVFGTYLNYHMSSSETAAKIRQQKWDFVIFQDAGVCAAYPDTGYLIVPPYDSYRYSLKAALKNLNDKVVANWSQSKSLFIMPWAYEDGLTWVRGQSDTYDDMQNKIISNTTTWAKELNFLLAPVGAAFQPVMHERTQLHYLYVSDFNHPSIRGSYLMACVVVSSIWRQTLQNIDYYASLEKDEALYFQRIASETVMNNLKLWNLATNKK